MPFNLRLSNRLSNRLTSFRFSLRSPTSPASPKFVNNNEQSLSICHSSRSPSPDEKNATNIGVHIVDGEGAPGTPRALPTPSAAPSPATPWHASFHRNAASTSQETAYLKRTAYLRYGRLSLSVLLFALGLTLTALESDILSRYNKTNLSADWHLGLWPTDLNLTPALLTLVTAIVTTLLALLTIVISLIPTPSPRTTLTNTLFTLLVGLATSLSFATIVVAGSLSPAAIFGTFVSSTLTSLVTTTGPAQTTGLTPNGHGVSPRAETIQSFTCSISNTARAFKSDAVTLGLPSLSDERQLVPSGFAHMCSESRAGLAVAVCVLGLAVVGVVVAGMSWMVERKIQGLRGEREVTGARDGADVGESLGGVPYEKRAVEV
ncbi:hypothetical protein LTR70_008160 [Exophiala xenobiotica]|uniref:Uncharacterized protein n=1 Tax=Lithohypha guttulata TaxID=1690604 RepID=A0ABR0K1Z9_9EURO|nr:hypothetical protein LTR24_007747 [Lithohypha guttulata]KAK5312479.1 hypothetical protein LTR70_008160 [Exophiala xenobiotica]